MKFSYSKSKIMTNTPWNRPDVHTFIKLLPECPFSKSESYLYSAFPWRDTWDIDIFILQKLDETLAEKCINFCNLAHNDFKLLLDLTFIDNTIFFQAPEIFNRTGKYPSGDEGNWYKIHSDKIYKNGERLKSSPCTQVSENIWKMEKTINKEKKERIFYPIRLDDFENLYFQCIA